MPKDFKIDFRSFKFGLLAGICEIAYCLLIVLWMSYMQTFSGQPDNGVLPFMLILLLFVFSAAISGVIVFGYPLYLALDRRFNEAASAIIATLTALALAALSGFVIVITFI